MAGELKKLTITAYAEPTRIVPVLTYELMLNPKQFKRSVNISYNPTTTKSSFGQVNRFSQVNNEEVSIEFMIDGIGTTGQKRDVAADAEYFLAVCKGAAGLLERPNFLRLNWGVVVMSAVLTSADVTYTLFKPDGTPIRAMVSASFREDRNKALSIAENARNVIANTNISYLAETENLATKAFDVYKKKVEPTLIAKANGIKKFRDIAPGTKITFPPLK